MANSSRPAVLEKVKPVSLAFKLRTRQKIKEALIQFLLFIAALIPVITVFGILFSLVFEAVAFFREVSLSSGKQFSQPTGYGLCGGG